MLSKAHALKQFGLKKQKKENCQKESPTPKKADRMSQPKSSNK